MPINWSNFILNRVMTSTCTNAGPLEFLFKSTIECCPKLEVWRQNLGKRKILISFVVKFEKLYSFSLSNSFLNSQIYQCQVEKSSDVQKNWKIEQIFEFLLSGCFWCFFKLGTAVVSLKMSTEFPIYFFSCFFFCSCFLRTIWFFSFEKHAYFCFIKETANLVSSSRAFWGFQFTNVFWTLNKNL